MSLHVALPSVCATLICEKPNCPKDRAPEREEWIHLLVRDLRALYQIGADGKSAVRASLDWLEIDAAQPVNEMLRSVDSDSSAPFLAPAPLPFAEANADGDGGESALGKLLHEILHIDFEQFLRTSLRELDEVEQFTRRELGDSSMETVSNRSHSARQRRPLLEVKAQWTRYSTVLACESFDVSLTRELRIAFDNQRTAALDGRKHRHSHKDWMSSFFRGVRSVEEDTWMRPGRGSGAIVPRAAPAAFIRRAIDDVHLELHPDFPEPEADTVPIRIHHLNFSTIRVHASGIEVLAEVNEQFHAALAAVAGVSNALFSDDTSGISIELPRLNFHTFEERANAREMGGFLIERYKVMWTRMVTALALNSGAGGEVKKFYDKMQIEVGKVEEAMKDGVGRAFAAIIGGIIDNGSEIIVRVLQSGKKVLEAIKCTALAKRMDRVSGLLLHKIVECRPYFRGVVPHRGALMSLSSREIYGHAVLTDIVQKASEGKGGDVLKTRASVERGIAERLGTYLYHWDADEAGRLHEFGANACMLVERRFEEIFNNVNGGLFTKRRWPYDPKCDDQTVTARDFAPTKQTLSAVRAAAAQWRAKEAGEVEGDEIEDDDDEKEEDAEGEEDEEEASSIFHRITTLQLEQRLIAAQLRRTRKATLPAFRIAWHGNPMIFHLKCEGPVQKYEGSLAVNDDGTCQLTLTNRMMRRGVSEPYEEKLFFADDAADSRTHLRGVPWRSKFFVARGSEENASMSGEDVAMGFSIFVRSAAERKLIIDAVYRRIGWKTSGVLVLSLTKAGGSERTQLTWFAAVRSGDSTALDTALGSSSSSPLQWRQRWCRPTSRLRAQRCASRGTKDVAVIIQGPLQSIGHRHRSAEREENPEVLNFAGTAAAERFERILKLQCDCGLQAVLAKIHEMD